MQCSGQYGVPDMQQELMLAAGGATHHMFSPQQDGGAHHHHHPQHQHYHHSLQQQQAAHEMLELYHRQAGLQQEPQDGLHLSPPELHGTHILFGLHHLQQKALPLTHQMSLGSDSPEMEISALAAPRSTSTTSHDHLPQYKPMLASCRDPVSTMDSTAAEDFTDMGADDADKGALSCSRWPRQETLALLQIRSNMDALFRDSALKGPLWEEVSRKLYEAGYQRSAKKCKEKFENVHKYYKKTKDGKSEKQDGKTYRFRTELEAIYATNHEHDMEAVGAATMAHVLGGDGTAMFSAMVASGDPNMQRLEGDVQMMAPGQDTSSGPKSSSSTSCGNEVVLEAAQDGIDITEQQTCGQKRKRNSWRSMRAFFEDLAKQLMERQDALHKKFLEAIERREEERVRREEAYKKQEMARMSREQELRAREQALAATRDAALMAFLHKVTGETLHLPEMMPPVTDAAGCTVGDATAATTPSGEDLSDMKEGGLDANSRRWPKVEVLALIRVRTSLEPRFQEAGPKAQLWEEVSSSMACLGFSRSGKRCKEKWENINKYYRKTKDNVGRKLRPESATKTCPYFHQLEVLYERGILASPNSSSGINKSTSKLDGPQTSGEFLESTSKDESQQTHEVNGNHNYQQAGGSVSDVHMSANVQATDDGRDLVVPRCPTTTCSSTGATNPLCNGINVHDMSTRFDFHDSKTEPGLVESDPINVNCHPPPHFSDRISQGQLPHEGTHFVREMMEIQQQHQHQH
eukprot:c19012_g2_i1 orf=1-2238(-)